MLFIRTTGAVCKLELPKLQQVDDITVLVMSSILPSKRNLRFLWTLLFPPDLITKKNVHVRTSYNVWNVRNWSVRLIATDLLWGWSRNPLSHVLPSGSQFLSLQRTLSAMLLLLFLITKIHCVNNFLLFSRD